MISAQQIERAGRLLAQAAGEGARIILFGSHARAQATNSSDLDFLVIEPEVADRHAEMVRLRRVLDDPELPTIPIDVLVVSAKQAADWGHLHGTVINAALAEGRVLHE